MSKLLAAAAALSLACAGSGSDPGAPAPGGGTRVSLINRATEGAALTWVAFQDGDGPWQTVQATGGTYRFSARSGRYGVAFVCAGSAIAQGEVVHATVTELPELHTTCGHADPGPARTLQGQLLGIPAGSNVFLLAGSSSRVSRGHAAPSGAYQVNTWDGTYDIAAVALAGSVAQRVLLRRDVAVSGDLTLDLDFQGPEGHGLVTPSLTVPELDPAEHLGGWNEVRTRRTYVNWQLGDPNKPIESYPALEATELAPDDTQELHVVASGGTFAVLAERGLVRVQRQPLPLDLALPPAFSPTMAFVGDSTRRPRFSFPTYPGARFYQLLSYYTDVQFPEKQWLVTLTASWLGAKTSYELPDFTSLSGFDPAWLQAAKREEWLEGRAISASSGYTRILADRREAPQGADFSFAKQIERRSVPP